MGCIQIMTIREKAGVELTKEELDEIIETVEAAIQKSKYADVVATTDTCRQK